MPSLRIELDERDGFIYVREKVGKHWKPKFRGVTMTHVLKTLTIMYAKDENAVHKKERNEPATSVGTLETVQQ